MASSSHSSHTVLPPDLPPQVRQVLRQALHPEPLEKGINWVLEKMSDKRQPPELMKIFFDRYQEQIFQIKGDVLEGHETVFRAALALRCLGMLHFYDMRFADKAYNGRFLRTWLQKLLLATIMGITERDIELKIHHSGRTPPRYLEDHLNKLIPHTCLKSFFEN